MSTREPLAIVWLKRDLRILDNEAIFNAINTGKKVLLLYVFEDFLMKDPHYDVRHWNFIKESIADLNKTLVAYNSKILAVNSEVAATINQLQQRYKIQDLFSHQETGLASMMNRDKKITRYCHNNLIKWNENIWNGVFRNVQIKRGWVAGWTKYMESPMFEFEKNDQLLSIVEINELEKLFTVTDLSTPKNSSIQKGGVNEALKFQQKHFQEAFLDKKTSNSNTVHESCSRLSPYIAWGNLSTRQVWQAAKKIRTKSKNKKDLDAFTSRLKWQAYFIQKFDKDQIMENSNTDNANPMLKKSIASKYQEAWQTGQTGIPMVDASMRCLNQTGYLNFRMRAMIVSFYTQVLWQPWQSSIVYLSKMFIDFEPAIHFAQVQIHATENNSNTLSIYSPLKNGDEHETNAEFIRKWIPELAHLETKHIHEPYAMTPLEQNLFNLKIGIDYPKPIIDLKENKKRTSKILWEMKNDPLVMQENDTILSRKTIKKNSLNIAG